MHKGAEKQSIASKSSLINLQVLNVNENIFLVRVLTELNEDTRNSDSEPYPTICNLAGSSRNPRPDASAQRPHKEGSPMDLIHRAVKRKWKVDPQRGMCWPTVILQLNGCGMYQCIAGTVSC